MSRLLSSLPGLGACLAGALAAAACNPSVPPQREAFSPKCPEHLQNWAAADSGEHGLMRVQTIGMIVASGNLAGMPEVNDCQRLVSVHGDGTRAYGPLGVLFASRSLEALFARSVGGGTQYPAHAAATINSWPGGYPWLHLPAGWSCLYIVRRERSAESHRELMRVRGDTAEVGRVVAAALRTHAANAVDTALIRSDLRSAWVGEEARQPEYVHAAYVVPADPTADGAVECPVVGSERLADFPALGVSATPLVDAAAAPSAARWDADFGNGGQSQHISVRCGDAWCDVMPTDAAGPVPDLRPDGVPADAMADLKGWYDQQYLAVPDPAKPGSLMPGPTLATYVPARGMGNFTQPQFDEWRVVGYIHLGGESAHYKDKLNLEPGWNTVSMRRGELTDAETPFRACRGEAVGSEDDAKHKPDPWWVRIGSAGGRVSYYCSYRHQHPSATDVLPGIVRWRWLDDDETTWQRCPQGCCPIS